MKFAYLVAGVLSLATGIDAVATKRTPTRTRKLLDSTDPEYEADKKNEQYWITYQNNMRDILKKRTSGCTLKNVEYRENWDTMGYQNKINYINAVKCLHNIPSSWEGIDGVRSRFDEFTATHLQQTPFIHFDGLFLSWHREFVNLFMKAMRLECDYTGPTPYWDWSKHYKNPLEAGVLDGSETSLSGDGEFIPGRLPSEVHFPFGPVATVLPGTGGGCLKNGPMKDFQMHLGPFLPPSGPNNGTGYNPRCIVRDISVTSAANTRPSNVTRVLEAKDLTEFNQLLDDPITGVHVNGHFQLGGIQLDPFVSPSDPIFWPHHGMIDYLWSVWQGQDFEGRKNQVYGTSTIGNVPPSDPVTLDTLMDFEVFLTDKHPIRDFISTIDGPFCYIYN